MEIVVSNRHKPVSNEMKEEVAAKVQSLLEHKTLKVISVKIVLDNQRNGRNKAEILVNAKGVDFESDIESFDMNESIEKVVTAINKQIEHYLDKKQDHHKHRESIRDVVPATEEDEEDKAE